MEPDVADIRLALIRQWELVADAVDGIYLSTDSRCSGWTNREVLAHLYVQPYLVARFLLTAGTDKALLGVADNLARTSTYRQLIDVSARDGAARLSPLEWCNSAGVLLDVGPSCHLALAMATTGGNSVWVLSNSIDSFER